MDPEIIAVICIPDVNQICGVRHAALLRNSPANPKIAERHWKTMDLGMQIDTVGYWSDLRKPVGKQIRFPGALALSLPEIGSVAQEVMIATTKS